MEKKFFLDFISLICIYFYIEREGGINYQKFTIKKGFNYNALHKNYDTENNF